MLFRSLSVFAGFDLQAARAQAGPRALELVAGLVEKSLLVQVPSSPERPRFRLLETLREFGAQRLDEAGGAAEARRTHLAHFTQTAESTFTEAQVASPGQLNALGPDLDNLRLAVRWSIENDPSMGLRLAGALRDIWFLRGQTEGWTALSALLRLSPDRGLARVRALVTAGQMANALQRHEEAAVALQEGYELATRLGLEQERGWAAYSVGVGAFLRRDGRAATEWLDRSLQLFEALNLPLGVIRSRGSRGALNFMAGNLDMARAELAVALELAAEVGDAFGQGLCHTYLAFAEQDRRAGASASAHLREAIRLLRSVGDITLLTLAIAGLASSGVGRDRRQAIRVAAAATAIRERIGGSFAPLVADRVSAFLSDCAEALGSDVVAAEVQAGRRLTLDDTVALALGEAPRGRKVAPNPLALSRREAEVAGLVSRGLSNRAIATRLHLSERTVENHVFRALSRLGLDNRTELAAWVLGNAASS